MATIDQLTERPARAFIATDQRLPSACARAGDRFTSASASVRTVRGASGLDVYVSSPKAGISRAGLRWSFKFAETTLFLGDHWERGYGDLQWRHFQPERALPWYFAAHDPATGSTVAVGVKTGPKAICFWTTDPSGITLWLDLRNGSQPVQLGERELHAATIVAMESSEGESPFAFLKRFCGSLCDSPRLPRDPVVGNNNWYYAYGTGFDAQSMLRDAELLAELAGSHSVRPFCVIDAGWTAGGGCPGGPWTHGLPNKFPDMPGLAAAMKRLNVRPGIWVRPTALSFVDDPRRLLAAPLRGSVEKPLDLTLSSNIATMKQDIQRLCSWGYELIKHDFSTWDAFGRWGMEMGPELTIGEWHWQDQTLTNAEVLLNWYTAMREAAGDTYLLGCNTIGHLAAGLFEIQRTGDDTSGRIWERTRKMGINTLAFRLPQHQTFFVADADCTAHTEKTPWEMDRQWLDLVARSGTALFISVNPVGLTDEKKAAFGRAVKMALDGGEPGGIEPLDWLFNTCPQRWRLGDRMQTFNWIEPSGASPFQAPA